ncbi:hypothetical protein C8F01DRAFT_710374 [Mycena amicta]|nr:hypothetical protein C8F01DRAFT_710374 [Mycena amicta]
MGSLGVYLWAATSTNANTDARVTKIIRERGGGEVGAIDNRVLLLERAYEVKESLERGLYRLRQTTQGLPTIPQTAILEAYAYVATKWIQAPDPLKVCWAICALNTSVFIAWRIPALAPFMLRNFLHRPLSGRVHTLLTSVFSHQSFMHLFFNCYALHGFGSATGYYLAQQQNEAPSKLLESTNAFHFIAFFISAGIFASFASHALRLRAYDLIKRNLVATALRRAKGSVGGSLGASGAIYSCVAVAALAFPQLHVNVLFIPIDIPIQTAVGSLVLMDIVGLVRGWSTFDHIAHLGGALFGLVYYMYGPKIWDRCRVTCARWFGGKRKLVVY